MSKAIAHLSQLHADCENMLAVVQQTSPHQISFRWRQMAAVCCAMVAASSFRAPTSITCWYSPDNPTSVICSTDGKTCLFIRYPSPEYIIRQCGCAWLCALRTCMAWISLELSTTSSVDANLSSELCVEFRIAIIDMPPSAT